MSLEDKLFDTYGTRLNLKALAKVLGKKEQTIRTDICKRKFPIPVFKLKNGHSDPWYADYRAVAKHINETSAYEEPTFPGRGGYTGSKSSNPSSR